MLYCPGQDTQRHSQDSQVIPGHGDSLSGRSSRHAQEPEGGVRHPAFPEGQVSEEDLHRPLDQEVQDG
jgi:hypothetical protein